MLMIVLPQGHKYPCKYYCVMDFFTFAICSAPKILYQEFASKDHICSMELFVKKSFLCCKTKAKH